MEEEQNHSKPRAEEERITTSNLVRKRKEVIKSAETLNLARTEEQSISLLKFPYLVRKGKGTSKLSKRFEPRAEDNANRKIHQKFLNLAWNRGQNIRYYHYGKFRMESGNSFLSGPCLSFHF